MDIFQQVKEWVTRQLGPAAIDQLGPKPEDIGLFPQGIQILRDWEDVMGNRKRQVRYSFLLRFVAPPGENATNLLLRLQISAPEAGISATGGKLYKAASAGLAIYELRLLTEREESI